MMLAAGRNQAGLIDKQIEYCVEVWEVLCADRQIVLDVSEAGQNFSRTRFNVALAITLALSAPICNLASNSERLLI